MPTYEYFCKQCGHEFEKFQMITAEPVKICPECGGVTQRKMGMGAGILFKGSGFYSHVNAHSVPCGKEQPCCGRDTFCGDKHCGG